MRGTIDVNDFMDHLIQNDLIIVSRSDFKAVLENDTATLQAKILSQDAATIADIIKSRILNVKAKNTIRNWIRTGVITQDEYHKVDGIILIKKTCINRLRKLIQNG